MTDLQQQSFDELAAEKERAFLEELRTRTTVPDVPTLQAQWWCQSCTPPEVHATDSPYSDCPVCEDKKRKPRRPLSRYLFGAVE